MRKCISPVTRRKNSTIPCFKLLTKRRGKFARYPRWSWYDQKLDNRFAGRVLVRKFPNDRIYDFLAIAGDPYVRED